AIGLDRDDVASCRRVLPGVRFACDSYVSLCRESPLPVAVASSLTEMFSPDLMSARIAAWEKHYPWVGTEALAYFRSRVPRVQRDRLTGKPFLLYPERGLELSDSAARIVALCDGARSIAAIADELAAASGAPRERIETEVIDFLRALDDRGLLVVT